MSMLFTQVLNMSMTGSVVILLVMLARLILKRSPKIFSYILWSVVLFRLLCPVAFTAPVSVLNALEPEVQEASEVTSVVYFLPAEVNQNPEFTFVPAENQSGTELARTGESEHTGLDLMTIVSYVWITGTGIMILYSIIQHIRLRLKLVGAMAYRGNVYRADYIDTPFVMGVFSPKIYLPSDVPPKERKYIIAHERHHIRRCDHIIKFLAYCALCIHWFNPLVWAAFILAGKDMEMSCDEAVIRKMGSQIRADYSASLLRLATHKKIIAGMPLAFGEGDTKGRVMNMAKWKKPRLWVSLICLLLCATILVACAVNPETADFADDTNTTVITGSETEAKKLNICQEPDVSSAVVGQYSNGTIVTILETKDGWGRTEKGWIYMDYVATIDGNTIVDVADYEPATDGSSIITDTELVQYGTLKMLLPSGFASREQDGDVVLTRDSVDVGGITSWNYPEFQPSDIVELRKEEYGDPIGYMSSSSTYGDTEYEIFRDGNPEELCEQHTFFIDGDIVYDVWYAENQISAGIAERFLKTVAINAEPVVTTEPGEQEAFTKCRAVLDAVQKGIYKIVTRQVTGRDENAMGHERIYSRSGEDWLSVTNVLPMGEDFTGEVGYAGSKSALCVNGKHFNYTGTEWVEIADVEIARLPWLAEFTWDENIVAYMDTLTDEDGECVMLRVDEKYIDSDEYDPHYFLYFNFDSDGNFVNAQLQVNLFRDNELAITESIVSLDPETVNSEIQKEYQRVIG